MLGKKSGGVLFQLPFRNPTILAGTAYPFVSEPSGRSGISGIVNPKSFSAMSCYFRKFALLFYGTDSMEDSCSGGPEFDLIEQKKKLHLFSVITFFFLTHSCVTPFFFLRTC
jgi:hypothetical protein